MEYNTNILFVYKYRVMWCSANIKCNQNITTVTGLTIQYIYIVQIFSIINAISSMANDGIVMETLCMCFMQHITSYTGIGLYFTFIRINIVNAASIYLI